MERVETRMSNFLITGLVLGKPDPATGARSITAGTIVDKSAVDNSENENILRVYTAARDQLRIMRNALLQNAGDVYPGADPDAPAVGVVPNYINAAFANANVIIKPANTRHDAIIAAEEKAAPGQLDPTVVDALTPSEANPFVEKLYSAIKQSKTRKGIERTEGNKNQSANSAFQLFLGGDPKIPVPGKTSFGSVNDRHGLIGKIVDIALALLFPAGQLGGSSTALIREHASPRADEAYPIAVAAIADLNQKLSSKTADAALQPLIATAVAIADPNDLAQREGVTNALAALRAGLTANQGASRQVKAAAEAQITRLSGGTAITPRGPMIQTALGDAVAIMRRIVVFLRLDAGVINPGNTVPPADITAVAARLTAARDAGILAPVTDPAVTGLLTQVADVLANTVTIINKVGLDRANPAGAPAANIAGAVDAINAAAGLDDPNAKTVAGNIDFIQNAVAEMQRAPPAGIRWNELVGGRRNRSSPRKSRKLRENIRRRRNTRQSKH
jgi:hypothetical protein